MDLIKVFAIYGLGTLLRLVEIAVISLAMSFALSLIGIDIGFPLMVPIVAVVMSCRCQSEN